MRKQYKTNDDGAKPVFLAITHFCAEIPAVAAAILSEYPRRRASDQCGSIIQAKHDKSFQHWFEII